MQQRMAPIVVARLSAIVVASAVLAFAVPGSTGGAALGFAIAASLVFGTVVSMLVFHAAERRRRFLDAVRIELNKLRRLYHLAKNLSTMSQKYRGWFTDMHGLLYGYLSLFNGKNFEAYDGFNPAFRKLSYHVYTVPEIETGKEAALFNDMLKTTALVAESRQQIKELWDNRLALHTWAAVVILALAAVVAALCAIDPTLGGRIAGAGAIAAIGVALELLWEMDSLGREKTAVPTRYVENMARLELGRKEE